MLFVKSLVCEIFFRLYLFFIEFFTQQNLELISFLKIYSDNIFEICSQTSITTLIWTTIFFKQFFETHFLEQHFFGTIHFFQPTCLMFLGLKSCRNFLLFHLLIPVHSFIVSGFLSQPGRALVQPLLNIYCFKTIFQSV